MVWVVLGLWALGFFAFWRVRSPRQASAEGRSVTVVIPARNEERNLPRLLRSLAAQTPPPHEILVVDDASTDATAEVARVNGARVLAGKPLPARWTGKPWACQQGADLATGELLLFLDADTWLEPGGLARLVAAHEEEPGLLSVQPYHQMASHRERLGALFNLITMIGIGAFTALGPRVARGASFGPCVLVAREDYVAVGGHSCAADSVLEGLALGRAFGDAGYAVRCMGGQGSVSFRMYPDGVASMIDGFAKGFATGAATVPTWLLVTVIAWVAGAVSTTRRLALAVALGATSPWPWVVLAVLYALQLRWMLARVGNYGSWPAVLFPVPVFFFVGVFALSLFRTRVLGRVSWKGRTVVPR